MVSSRYAKEGSVAVNGPKASAFVAAIILLFIPVYLGPASSAAAVESGFAANAQVTVNRIRIGRHQGMTRIVLDASGPIDFDYQVSEGGKALVLMLPKVVWKARDYIRMGKDRAIYRVSFMANRSTGGGVLTILGRRKLALGRVEVLKPWRHWGHRVALDIPHEMAKGGLPAVGVVRDGKIGRSHARMAPVMQYGVDGAPKGTQKRRIERVQQAEQTKPAMQGPKSMPARMAAQPK
jgi:hypothetical protein